MRFVQCPALRVKRSLACVWQRNTQQTSNILGLLFPADAAWQMIWAGPKKGFNPQHLHIPRDCPAAQLSASLTSAPRIFSAPPQCKTQQTTRSLFLLYEAERKSVWHPKTLSLRSQALHPAKHIRTALPLAGMLYI